MKSNLRWWALGSMLALAMVPLASCSDDDDDDDDVTTNDDDDVTPTDDDDDDVTPNDDDDDDDITTDDDDTPPEHQREMFEAPSGQLKAGVGQAYLTGPVGASKAGYGTQAITTRTPWNQALNGSTGFLHYYMAKAMALDVDGERVVFVKLPLMSSETSITEGVEQKLMDDYGIDLTGRIVFGATHSHQTIARYWRLPNGLGFAGADEPDEEIISRLVAVFTEAVKKAIDDLGPAEWGYVMQDDWDPNNRVYRDRRGEDNPTYGKDPRLTLFAVRRPDGTPMATLINFGMHGTIFGGGDQLFTDDAPGGMEMGFEEYFYKQEGKNILGMFIQSAGGNQSPAGDHLGHRGTQVVEMVGHNAAPLIYDLYKTIEWSAETSLAVRSRRIDLRYSWMGYDDYPEFKDEQGNGYTWGAWRCSGDSKADDNNPDTSWAGEPKACIGLDVLIPSLGGEIPAGEVHQVYLTTARVGNLFFVSLPGEPLYSTIKYLREEVANRSTTENPIEVMGVGYSQDHYLYLPMEDDWLQGGYEQEMTLWGPLYSRYLVDRQMELVEDMLEGYNRPVWYEESPDLSNPPAFTPRPFEKSLAPGEVTQAPGTEYGRGQTVRFAWNGGDSSVGSPYVVVESIGDEGFTPVPGPIGDSVLDNSRISMITIYDPTPPPDGTIHDERTHGWHVDWQVPADFPAGLYNFRVQQDYWDGSERKSLDFRSGPFTVGWPDTVNTSATLIGDMLQIQVSLDAPPYVTDQEACEGTDIGCRASSVNCCFEGLMKRSWPREGFRLLDPTVGPNGPIAIRAALEVQIHQNGGFVGGENLLPLADGSYPPLDVSAYSLNPADGPISATINLATDLSDAYLEIPVSTAP